MLVGIVLRNLNKGASLIKEETLTEFLGQKASSGQVRAVTQAHSFDAESSEGIYCLP